MMRGREPKIAARINQRHRSLDRYLSGPELGCAVTISTAKNQRDRIIQGDSMRRFRAASVVLAALVLIPSVASAQATITGVVKDASGGVLPGVTVEAASPTSSNVCARRSLTKQVSSASSIFAMAPTR
jgi:hypothetical protein